MQRTFPTTDIYAITDNNLSLGRSLEHVVNALLQAGVRIVQYREKDKDAGIMLEECRLLRRLTQEAGACFIVNDHIDIALLVDADGVHVGQDDLTVAETRRLIGPNKILGLSVSNAGELAAVPAGVDYLGIGPVYPTGTKRDAAAATGVAEFAELVAAAGLPVVAIGGISAGNLSPLFAAGTHGVAVVSAICGQDDPARATARLARSIQESRSMRGV